MNLYHYGASLTTDAPEGSKYLGCFKDLQSDRALSHKSTSRSDMTHEVRGHLFETCTPFKQLMR